MARRWVLLLSCGLLLTLLGTSRAETSTPAAKVRFERGRVEFHRGQFREALADFEAAYELAPAPPLLFDIGRCKEELGDVSGALAAYRLFLPFAGDEQIEMARTIKRLEDRVHAGALVAAAPPRPRRRWVWPLVGSLASGAAVALAVGLGLGLGLRRAPSELPPVSWASP